MKLPQEQSVYQLAITPILALSIILTTANLKSLAQITPDTTLGSENSIVNSSSGVRDLIEGGATRGTNLFHSFLEFNVGENSSVYFANPGGIANILTRVTGGNISHILGKLGVEGEANLYLLNPHGIMFGRNASLDVRGSFTATTADSIRLGENGLFSAINPQSSNLLKIQPEALFINAVRNQLSRIENQANLTVVPTKNITLLSANVINSGRLIAPEGIVQIIGSEDLIFRGNVVAKTLILDTNNFTISEDDNSTINPFRLSRLSGNTNLIFRAKNDFIISPAAGTNQIFNLLNGSGSINFTADSDGNGNGGVQMDTTQTIKTNGRNIQIQGVNLILGKIDSSSKLAGGNITLTATSGNITTEDLDSSSFSFEGNAGNGGAITLSTQQGNITTENLNTSSSSFEGNAGNGGAIALSSQQGNITTKDLNSYSLSFSGDAGNGGAIALSSQQGNITTDKINSYSLSFSGNAGDGGAIALSTQQGNITAQNLYSLSWSESQDAESGGEIYLGAGGNIGVINNKVLEILTLSSAAKSGNVNIESFGDLSIINTNIITSKQEKIEILPGVVLDVSDIGQSGNVTITSKGNLTFNNSRIESDTKGNNPAGNVTINSPGMVSLNNSQIISNTSDKGEAGNIQINANDLNLTNNSTISASTFADGQAGDITLKIQDQITLDGTNTGIFANTEKGSTGASGSLNIDTKNFIIKNNAKIGVNSQGTFTGGDIFLQADTLILDNQGLITAETASNQGGNININLNNFLLLRNNSGITATAGTNGLGGNGGNINITTPFIIAFPNENSDITANAFTGDGGKINITANAIFGLKYQLQLTSRSDITASSQFGLSGEVQINTPDVDPTSGLIELPGNLVDVESLVGKDICSAEQLAKQNYFTINGKGGLPAESDDLISNSPGLIEWANRSSKPETTPVEIRQKDINQVNINNPVIQEAQGWIITADGRVILTANAPKVTPQNSGLNHPSCHQLLPTPKTVKREI